MQTERWARLKDLFNRAIDMAAVERNALLSSLAREDPSLHRELVDLLDADKDSGEFLDEPLRPSATVVERALKVLPRAQGSGLEPGEMVDHFRVLRLLGKGGMGEVYLARDTKLGRKVALKVVRPSVLDREQHTALVLAEARNTARFNHPNIVSVYAVGEHGGMPYVAFEYLEGQNLAERMCHRKLGLQEILRFGAAIAEALREAHAHGVLHRDLKPGNVVIARDGRIRVVDFGIAVFAPAVEADAAPDSMRRGLGTVTIDSPIVGTPGYMAPEQFERRDQSGATDIWAFGVMMFEMLSGVRPFEATSGSAPTDVSPPVSGNPMVKAALRRIEHVRARVCGPEPAPDLTTLVDVPAPLATLVARCLEKDAAKRPSAEELCEAMPCLVEGRRQPLGTQNPFRGLLPFSEQQAAAFFGRDAEVASFLELIRSHPVLPVIGPSGAGKSSFVQAGVVPRLREQERWLVLAVRPTTRPFEAVAARLLRPEQTGGDDDEVSFESSEDHIVVDEVDKGSLAQRLYRSPTQLSLELRALAEQHDAKVLLFVDQLEELLTLNDSTELHQRFMQAICTAADDALDPVRVVFAARDDFLARLAVGPEAREALRHVTVMQTLEPSALREVLLRPIEAIGYRYEDDALVDEMIDAVRGEPACLPLLQFAAQLLWERADKSKRLLLRSPYDEMGGVAGALAKHADGVLDALSPPELDLARALLLRLCTAEGTRRVIAREPLLHGLDGGAEQVLDRLIEARLVTVTKSRGAVESDALLELAHESLIRNWATLARWLADSGEEVAFLAEVEQAAELWRKRGRRADELWRGDALRDALRRWERIVHRAAAASRDFLSAGRDAELRRVRGRRAITAVAGATLVAAALVFALQKREANRQRDIAEQERTRAIEQRTLADQRRGQALIEGARSALSQGRQLEARAKLRMALEIGDDPAARALWWQLADEPIAWNARLGTYVYGVSFSPDGTKLAAACGDGAIHLFDTRTQSSRSLRGHRDPKALTVSFSPDGRQLASAGWDNEVRLWDVEQGRAIRAFAGHRDGIYGLSFSPDGATIASASIDRTVRTWNVATGQAIATLEHPGGVHAVRFDPSGTLLASACVDGRVRLWNTSGALVREIAGHEQPARDIAFTPDSRSLASAGNDGRVRLWDVATGETRGTIHAHSDRATAVAISPNGKLLLSGGFPGELRLWNLETKQLLRELPGHGESVWSVTFDRSGALAASTGFDYEVRLWDVAKAAVPGRTTKPHSKGVQRVAFSPDGKTLLSSGGDNTMRMWRMTTGEVFRVIQGHTGRVNMVAFSPDGQRIASASHDRTVRIWSSETGKELLSYGGHRSAAVAVAFSIDGRIVTSGGYDGSIASWDARTGRELHTFEGHTLGVLDLTLANDALLASASFDGTARLWDFKTGKLVTVLESLGKLYGVGLDPSATRLATAGNDGTLRLFDVGKRPPIELMRKSHPGRLLDAHYSRDGRSIAAAHSDGSVSVTAVATGSVHRWTAHSGEVNGVELSADGSLLASCADDGTVRLWDAATGTTKWRGPALLPSPVRFFSHRGWHSGDGTSLASPTQAFGKAIEQHALFAEASASVACVHTEDGTELWDVARDAPLGKLAGKTLDVRAMPNGCVIRERDAVRLLTKDGITEIPIGSPSVAAWVPPASGSAIEHGGVAVATETELIAYDASGRELSRVSVGGGVKAIARAHDGTLIIGFGDGGIELHGARGKRADAPSFEQVPASAVSRIVPGPGSTAAIGYSNGVVGLWSLTDGKLFASELLHGQVHHLLIEGQTLHAASDLGDRLAWDLRAFSEDYCHLLQKIWGAVPVVWSSGRAVESVPVHRCVDASTH